MYRKLRNRLLSLECGYRADVNEVNALQRDLNGQLPDWYAEMLTQPICGVWVETATEYEEGDSNTPPEAEMQYCNYYDRVHNESYRFNNGFVEKHHLWWHDPTMIRLKSLETFPGSILLPHGYVCIASNEDTFGSDFYMWASENSGNEDTWDDKGQYNGPPVCIFDPKVGQDAEVLMTRGKRIVWKTMAGFFDDVLLVTPPPGFENS